MSTRSMDVFSLRDSVIGEYRKFATSFTPLCGQDIRQQGEALYAEGRFWPDPLIQINPSYKQGKPLELLIADGKLHGRIPEICQLQGAPIRLHKHQEQAIALAADGESYGVTTGTGSGKSLCVFIPIVSAVLAEKRVEATRRTRAGRIYPMERVANSAGEGVPKGRAHGGG